MKKNFGQIYKDNFKVKLKGRATRKDYIYFFIGNIFFSIFISAATMVPASIIIPLAKSEILSTALAILIGIICVVWSLTLITLNICINVRRFHDFNASGWWIGGQFIFIFIVGFLFALIGIKGLTELLSTLLGIIYFLVCVFVPSNKEANKYGEPVSHEIN